MCIRGITDHCAIDKGEYVAVVKGFLHKTRVCLAQTLLQQLLLGKILPLMEGSQEMVWPRGSQLGVSITASVEVQNEAGGVCHTPKL